MDTPTRKIDQLVSDARIELKRLGIDTKGKRSDELLKMAREERNKLRVAQLKLHEPGGWPMAKIYLLFIAISLVPVALSYGADPARVLPGITSPLREGQAIDWVVIRENTEGEYGNECVMGLALGKDIKTDCSVNTVYKGKTYCFGNETAKSLFLKKPEEFLLQAQIFYSSKQQQ